MFWYQLYMVSAHYPSLIVREEQYFPLSGTSDSTITMG